MRRPFTPRPSAPRNRPSAVHAGRVARVEAAITPSTIARSSALRASAPPWSSDEANATMP
jgi:hypothetical protein